MKLILYIVGAVFWFISSILLFPIRIMSILFLTERMGAIIKGIITKASPNFIGMVQIFIIALILYPKSALWFYLASGNLPWAILSFSVIKILLTTLFFMINRIALDHCMECAPFELCYRGYNFCTREFITGKYTPSFVFFIEDKEKAFLSQVSSYSSRSLV